MQHLNEKFAENEEKLVKSNEINENNTKRIFLEILSENLEM